MPKFVVCMDSHYVRDTQMVETSDMSDDEFENVDVHSEMMEGHWHDMDPNPFIDVVKADNQDEACKIAGEEHGYDPRTLFAIQA